MPQWFVKGLRRGVVTTRYPARPDPLAAVLPGPPAFRADALTSQIADDLVQICPSRAFSRTAGTLIFDAGACTWCGRCRDRAPAAVTSSGEFELAVTNRSALVKLIPVRGDASKGEVTT